MFQAFLAYFLFYWTVIRNPELVELPEEVYQAFRKSIYRHWKFTRFSGSSGFGAVFLAFMGSHASHNDYDLSKKTIEEV